MSANDPKRTFSGWALGSPDSRTPPLARYVLRCSPKSLGNVGESRLLCIAHFYAADAEKAPFGRGFGHVLADSLQPGFEGGSILRRLGVENGRHFLQVCERSLNRVGGLGCAGEMLA